MSKYIKDPIYDSYLKFSPDELKLIDTKEFKRLKNIKQLGSLEHVFPGATHTRFSHSLGVAHQAETFTKSIYDNSNIGLRNGNDRICRNIKIAGLYHDIGHGPFSHVFDNIVLNKLCPNHILKNHEDRSCHILEKVCNKLDSTKFNGYDIDFIKNAINPTKKLWSYTSQIVSNSINSIDVDKFDYLVRDPYYIGFNFGFNYKRLYNRTRLFQDEIHYHESVANDIYDMYYTRYKYHREIYNHKAVKSIELMIGDILLESNDVYNFPSILDTPEFIDLDDTITTRIRYNNELLTKSKELLQRIDNRKLYKRIYESSDNIECVKDYIEDVYPDKKSDDFHIIKMNFDFCNKESTPFSNIKFYNNKLESVNYKNINIRKLIPNNFRETSVVVYEK